MIHLSELGGGVTLNPPTNLVAQVNGNNVSLSWTAPEAGDATLTGYKVYRDGTVITNNTITTTQYADSNVPAGNHSYYVKAVYQEGESAPSNTVDVTIGGSGNFVLDEGFEGATFPPTGWTLVDADGDNNNWAVFENEGANEYAYEGTKCAKSDSYINNVGALTPDNYLITNSITLPAGAAYTLTYWVAAQDPDWAGEHYSVMVSTTNAQPASFTSVFSETLASGDYEQRTVSLPYAGQNIYLAFRHHDVTDMFAMKIDAIKIEGNTATEGNNPVAVKNSLGKNYPNPFNPSTTIEYSIKENAHVTIEVFNVKGQKVRTLVNENKTTGNHSVVWNGKDDQNKNAGSGVYFYRMTTPTHTATAKMILMK